MKVGKTHEEAERTWNITQISCPELWQDFWPLCSGTVGVYEFIPHNSMIVDDS